MWIAEFVTLRFAIKINALSTAVYRRRFDTAIVGSREMKPGRSCVCSLPMACGCGRRFRN
jgi:hypothetical protein